MKKIKRERGFYKELKQWEKVSGEKIRPMWGFEFVLEHQEDPSKTIRIFINMRDDSGAFRAVTFLRGFKDGYPEHFAMRSLDVPRTRKEKTIHRYWLSQQTHSV